jgi:hypothetical protein
MFESKNQLVKALKRYIIVIKRSICFIKSMSDRVRRKVASLAALGRFMNPKYQERADFK